jgi:hypothetical protein
MIDYMVEIIEDQVIFTLKSFSVTPFEDFTSSDEFLNIIIVNGTSDGWVGYGGMVLYIFPENTSLSISTPHYEYYQDLLDVKYKIENNMREFIHGNVLS